MKNKKTHWKVLANPDYIGAYSLMKGEEKSELVVMIESVSSQLVTGPNNKQEECLVANLKDQKPFIINATNAKTITKLASSPYIEDWVGTKITLYVAQIKAFGDTVDALRIRPTAPTLPVLNPKHKSWDGAKKAIKDKSYTLAQIKASYSLSAADEKLLTDGK